MSSAAKKSQHMDKLNKDPLEKVAELLTHPELGALRATHRAARYLSFSAAITKITVPRDSEIQLNFWERYNLETVTEIDGELSNMTDADLEWVVAPDCPNLTSLNLQSCGRITDAAVIALAQGCPKLLSLNLRNCSRITSRGIIALTQGCSQLLSLNLHGCEKITDVAVIALSQGCPELSSLDLEWCIKITDAAVIALSQGCPRLSFLNLTFCQLLTDESVIALAQGCPGLATLSLYACYKVTYAAVIALAECQKLEKLNLTHTDFGNYDDWKLPMHNAQSFFDSRVRRRIVLHRASGAASQFTSRLAPPRQMRLSYRARF